MFQLELFPVSKSSKSFERDRSNLPDWMADIDDDLLGKILESIDTIAGLSSDRVYSISFSGGKDSHVVLGVYSLYLQLGGKPLDMKVIFADTGLEPVGIYHVIDLAADFCEDRGIPFERVYSNKSFWFYQFVRGYPVPGDKYRWCTSRLKTDPLDKIKTISLTGRHYGESANRDERLNKEYKSCGSNECGIDKIKKEKRIDLILNWRNCEVWDFIFFADGNCLYDGVFNALQNKYKKAEDIQSGSLRMGCAFCPVVGQGTIRKKFENGIVPSFVVKIRAILEKLRASDKIRSPKTGRLGACSVFVRRQLWQEVLFYKTELLEFGWISQEDIDLVTKALKDDYCYPPSYPRYWIEQEHEILLSKNIYTGLPLFEGQ